MSRTISIIIPVYNAEEYLEDCIRSVRRQSMTDWELLLVNDGSEDGSPAICQKYAARDERIRVLDGPNGGVSAARNRGLSEAAGEYVCFVDADDFFLREDALQLLLDTACREKSDIVVADYCRLWEGKLLPTTETAKGLAAWGRESRAFRFRGFYSGGVLSYVWGKLYRRSFLVKYGIRFPELSYAEDKVFSIHCYFCHASYAFAEGAVYAYRKNLSSVSFRYQADFSARWMMAARQMEEDLQSAGEKAAYEDLVWYCIVFAVFFCGKMEYEEKQRSEKAVRRVLQKFGEDSLAAGAFAAVSSREGVRGIDQRSWRWMLRGFSFAMKHHWYRALSAGIGLLVDRRVDEKLSDTGRRE